MVFGANRSPGLASSYWRAFPRRPFTESEQADAVAFFAFVRFTVTGIARKSHPRSHDARFLRAPRLTAQMHRLFICRLLLYGASGRASMLRREFLRVASRADGRDFIKAPDDARIALPPVGEGAGGAVLHAAYIPEAPAAAPAQRIEWAEAEQAVEVLLRYTRVTGEILAPAVLKESVVLI